MHNYAALDMSDRLEELPGCLCCLMTTGATKGCPHPAQRTRWLCMLTGIASMTRHCGFGQRNFIVRIERLLDLCMDSIGAWARVLEQPGM